MEKYIKMGNNNHNKLLNNNDTIYKRNVFPCYVPILKQQQLQTVHITILPRYFTCLNSCSTFNFPLPFDSSNKTCFSRQYFTMDVVLPFFQQFPSGEKSKKKLHGSLSDSTNNLTMSTLILDLRPSIFIGNSAWFFVCIFKQHIIFHMYWQLQQFVHVQRDVIV